MSGQSSNARVAAQNDIMIDHYPPRSRMPKPGQKNAPAFDTDKPEELGRFFERVEDWFEDEGIVSDVEKKKRIVRYLDPDSETQWKALSKFEDGTYAEFKAQVMKSYPAAEDVMKGSVAALKRKIKRIGPVEADDRDELLSLIRVMKAEVSKLKRINPLIHTNRELVELFLSRLSVDFAGRVAGKLSVKNLVRSGEEPAVANERNNEDMYDIEEVMEMANHTSMEHANPFGKFLQHSHVPKDSAVKYEEAVAKIHDSLELYEKRRQQTEQQLQSLMTQFKLSTQMSAQGAAQAPVYNRNGQYTSNSSGTQSGCFYCGGTHRMSACEHVQRHMDLSLVKKVDGKLRLFNGNYIPKDPTKTNKEVVESLNASKPGIIPMNKIGDRANLYQGAARVSNFMQNQLPVDEQEGLKNVLELIQNMGLAQAQKLLSASSESDTFVIDEDPCEYQSNFDLVQ
jgi:hypothetical protein